MSSASSRVRPSSLFLDKLLVVGVGVGSSPASSALTVSDLQVGGSAVDVVHAERRRSGHVVRVEHVRLLTSFTGESLLGEALVLHQLRVVTVFPALRQRQRVLEHSRQRGVNDRTRMCCYGHVRSENDAALLFITSIFVWTFSAVNPHQNWYIHMSSIKSC